MRPSRSAQTAFRGAARALSRTNWSGPTWRRNLSLSPDEASERATDELARAKRIIKARPLGQGKYGLLHGRKHYSSDPRWVLRREREARLKRLEAGEPEPAVGAAQPKPKKPHHGPLSAEIREERKLRMKVKRLHGGEWPPTLDAGKLPAPAYHAP